MKTINNVSILMSILFTFILCVQFISCSNCTNRNRFTGADGEIRFIVLDPAHFHASLAQKYRLPEVNKEVYVYAPKGKELDTYLNTIKQYNEREQNPTDWKVILYEGEDYLEKMLSEPKGNVVILAGDNSKKIDYIQKCLEAGINVLTDKPMVINPEQFDQLVASYNIAKEKRVILYDMMTERYDLINIIQGRLMRNKDLFGDLEKGSPNEPAILSESTHHFLKYVSDKPLIRPSWYYDVKTQGEGIVDVTTHLIDLIFFNCFQDEFINYKNQVILNKAERYPTKLSLNEFRASTGENVFPEFLKNDVDNDTLKVYSNGSIQYSINEIQIMLKVEWRSKAEEGAGDMQRFIVKGSKAELLILQGVEQQFTRQLYIQKKQNISDKIFLESLDIAIKELQKEYPEISVSDEKERKHIVIPKSYLKGHEEHFYQVVKTYLDYLKKGEIPDLEVNNTLCKYYITTKALKMSQE